MYLVNIYIYLGNRITFSDCDVQILYIVESFTIKNTCKYMCVYLRKFTDCMCQTYDYVVGV